MLVAARQRHGSEGSLDLNPKPAGAFHSLSRSDWRSHVSVFSPNLPEMRFDLPAHRTVTNSDGLLRVVALLYIPYTGP